MAVVVFFGFSFLGSFFIGQLWLIEHMCSFVICVNWPLSWPLSPSLLKKERSDSTQTDYYFGPVSVVYASRHGTVKLSFENSQIVFPHRAAARLIISYARYFKKKQKIHNEFPFFREMHIHKAFVIWKFNKSLVSEFPNCFDFLNLSWI